MNTTNQPYKNDEQLLDQAQTLLADAHALLSQRGLLDALQRVGPVFMSGSFKLNLMVRRDIDVYVQLANELDTADFFALGTYFTKHFQVLKASYSNHFIRNFHGFDHGLYWGIQLKFQGQPWKLDLWGYDPQHFIGQCDYLNQLQKNLEPFDRLIILRLKEALREGEHYRDNISGNDIYKAVLTGNIKTVEQLDAWWKRQERP